MGERFTPELGQYALSNTPWQQMEMEPAVESFLLALGDALESMGLCENSPAVNSGASFECDTFKMRAYCWCDGDADGHKDGCPPNFEWRDFTACWYKWAGRGNSQSRRMDGAELAKMATECYAAANEAASRNNVPE